MRERGTFEAWGKDPNKTLSVIQFPRMGTLKKGFDGETIGWKPLRAQSAIRVPKRCPSWSMMPTSTGREELRVFIRI